MDDFQRTVSFAQFVYFLREVNTSLKKYTNLAKLVYFSLVLREQEEKKTNISHLSDYLGNTDDAQRIYYLKHYINQLLKGTSLNYFI